MYFLNYDDENIYYQQLFFNIKEEFQTKEILLQNSNFEFYSLIFSFNIRR